jgi:galactoside 2-L-fucosyltransferase 1/2
MNGVRKNRAVMYTTLVVIVIIVVHVLDLGRRIAYYSAQLIQNHPTSRSVKTGRQCHCMIVLRERSGRLGNCLFMFASALGLALTHSCYLNISTEIINELNQSFELDLKRMPLRPKQNYSRKEHKIHNHCSYLAYPFRTNCTQNMEITGFWQVHTYFLNHSAEIRRQLRFKATILNQVDTFLQKNINSSILTRVGIHIRQVRTVSSVQYILKAMSYFTEKYHSVVFVIVSDDRPFCKSEFGKRNDVLFTPVLFDAAADLATITRCNHAIITVGTFGWWGAYLLHDRFGEVVTDAKPDLSPIDVNCEGRLYFPPWFSFLNKMNGLIVSAR